MECDIQWQEHTHHYTVVDMVEVGDDIRDLSFD